MESKKNVQESTSSNNLSPREILYDILCEVKAANSEYIDMSKLQIESYLCTVQHLSKILTQPKDKEICETLQTQLNDFLNIIRLAIDIKSKKTINDMSKLPNTSLNDKLVPNDNYDSDNTYCGEIENNKFSLNSQDMLNIYEKEHYRSVEPSLITESLNVCTNKNQENVNKNQVLEYQNCNAVCVNFQERRQPILQKNLIHNNINSGIITSDTAQQICISLGLKDELEVNRNYQEINKPSEYGNKTNINSENNLVNNIHFRATNTKQNFNYTYSESFNSIRIEDSEVHVTDTPSERSVAANEEISDSNFLLQSEEERTSQVLCPEVELKTNSQQKRYFVYDGTKSFVENMKIFKEKLVQTLLQESTKEVQSTFITTLQQAVPIDKKYAEKVLGMKTKQRSLFLETEESNDMDENVIISECNNKKENCSEFVHEDPNLQMVSEMNLNKWFYNWSDIEDGTFFSKIANQTFTTSLFHTLPTSHHLNNSNEICNLPDECFTDTLKSVLCDEE